METTLFSLSALLALIPASLVTFRKSPGRDGVFWAVLAVAVAGPMLWVYVRQSGVWHTGISTALWLTIVTSLVLFATIAAITREGWRLTPLLLPYLVVLGLLAMVWGQAPERPLSGNAPLAWIGTHIVVSVLTYGLITLAAVAALGAAIQDRALKTKRRNALSRLLPSVADSENLLVRLLIASEIILALGLLTGMATLYMSRGILLEFDHKTLFTGAVFFVIGALLWAHHRTGVRGRITTRVVLLAYLLLTLGYPGVKFVNDVLLS